MPTTLLIADQARERRDPLASHLDLDGYEVHTAATHQAARQILARTRPDLLVLGELERPAAGLALLTELRADTLKATAASLPVITLGATDTVTQLRAYEAGSDHHLDADTPYLLLRGIIAAVARRLGESVAADQHLQIGSLTLDTAARTAHVHDTAIDLTKREWELLTALAADPDRVFTKADLLKRIWGYHDPSTTRTLDSHACRLRRRLADHGLNLVANQWGVGYKLRP